MGANYGVYAELTGNEVSAELETDPASISQEVSFRVYGAFTGTVYVLLRRPDEVTPAALAGSSVTVPSDKLITLKGPYFVSVQASGVTGTANVELFGSAA